MYKYSDSENNANVDTSILLNLCESYPSYTVLISFNQNISMFSSLT
jgi:hypothetical protein